MHLDRRFLDRVARAIRRCHMPVARRRGKAAIKWCAVMPNASTWSPMTGPAGRGALCGFRAFERAGILHLSLDPLHRAAPNTKLDSNLQHALAGPQLALDALF